MPAEEARATSTRGHSWPSSWSEAKERHSGHLLGRKGAKCVQMANVGLSKTKKRRRHRAKRRRESKTWCHVYVLSDADGKPRYVGQTRLLLADRLRWHWKNIDRDRTAGRNLSRVQKWMVDVWNCGREPVIAMLDKEGIWDISEAVWIDRLTREGHDLLNILSRVGKGERG